MTHFIDRHPDAGSRCSARAVLRAAGCLGVVGLLSACAGGQQISSTQEASQYESRAHGSYSAPGPHTDPWGPYIHEASSKYDVPERWIREVMRVESGGRTEMGGRPITSGAGAMGLMQVMPSTYDELRSRYSLGDDPYDPHNSILAGTAYIRELYDLYGNPGFLAAYNGGPGRLDDYLTRNRALPEETRRYVAKIGPYITDSFPSKRSTAEMYALNSMPTSIPAGPRYTAPVDAPVEVAFAPPSSTDGAFDPPPGWTPKNTPRAERNAYVPPVSALPPAAISAPVTVASVEPAQHFEAAPMPAREPDLVPAMRPSVAYDPPPVRYTPPAASPRAAQPVTMPEPPRYIPPAPSVQTASGYGYASQLSRREQSFRLVSPAVAAPAPPFRGSPGEWAIQVGAFGNEGLARIAVGNAREQAGTVLSSAHQAVAGIHEQHGTLYRARLTGLSRDAATQACERLRSRTNCIVLSPDAQS